VSFNLNAVFLNTSIMDLKYSCISDVLLNSLIPVSEELVRMAFFSLRQEFERISRTEMRKRIVSTRPIL
jgi:hypothetical protein